MTPPAKQLLMGSGGPALMVAARTPSPNARPDVPRPSRGPRLYSFTMLVAVTPSYRCNVVANFALHDRGGEIELGVSACRVQVSGRSLGRSLGHEPTATARMPCPYARHGSHRRASRMLSDASRFNSPLFRIESFGVLLHSGCLVRSLGALRTCTETPVAFVAFCGCESDVLARPHRVSLCPSEFTCQPLGSRSFVALLVLALTNQGSLDSS